MEEVLAILFALLVFVGPMLFKLLGAIIEGITSSPKQQSKPEATTRSEFTERLRQHRRQREAEAIDAEVVTEVVPAAIRNSSPVVERDAYYNPHDLVDDKLELSDDRMDSHLHKAFDNSLGSFGNTSASLVEENVLGTEPTPTAPSENLAAGVAEMLRDRSSLRKAFILGEILQRPASMDR